MLISFSLNCCSLVPSVEAHRRANKYFFPHTFRTGSYILNSKTSSPQVTASYWFLLISSVILSSQGRLSFFLLLSFYFFCLSHLNFLPPCLSSLAFPVTISRKAQLVINVKQSENKYDCSASSVLWRHTGYLAYLYMTDFSSISALIHFVSFFFLSSHSCTSLAKTFIVFVVATTRGHSLL